MMQSTNTSIMAGAHQVQTNHAKMVDWSTLARAIAAAYWPLWSMVLLHAIATQGWIALHDGVGISWEGLLSGLAAFLFILLLVFVIWRMTSYLVREMPHSPLRALWRDLRDFLTNPARRISLLALFPAAYLFFTFFTQFKDNIALLNPFSWDERLMRLDAWLHGGKHPWEWLFPLFSSAPATLFINVAYHVWFLVMFGTILWAISQRQPKQDALRYLIAFMLTWGIGGGLLAYVFSSAGPVYYGRLGLQGDPYAPLMEHLRSIGQVVPVWALDVQETLWAGYQAGDMSLGGISAFPSMHNAQAMLMVLMGWRFGHRTGWAFTAFAAIIAVGSVWLGWHYAVDAYAGIAIALACWWAAAPLARWMMCRPAMQQLVALQQTLDNGRL